MNKRLPILLSLLGLILLAASLAYWVLQLYKPEQRPLAAAPLASAPAPSPDAAATLFGGQPTVVISNFQLTGVVSAGSDSAVILVADGEPPKAVRIGREIAPGVTVAEVHRRYVMLSDNGVMKRVELNVDSNGGAMMSTPATSRMASGPVGAAPPAGFEQTAPGVVSAPPTMQTGPPGMLPPAQSNNPQGLPSNNPQGLPSNNPQGLPQGLPQNPQTVPEPQMDTIDPNQPPDDPNNQQQAVQMPPNAPPMNQTGQLNR